MEQIFESVKKIEASISKYMSSDSEIAEFMMIENAAAALEKEVSKICSKKNDIVLILCGAGNNGADGYCLARKIAGSVKVYLLPLYEPKTFHCKSLAESIQKFPENTIRFLSIENNTISSKLNDVIEDAKVIVDCIFGTGFHGNVDDTIQALFKKVNHSDAKRIACDVPSGLDSTGKNISGFSLQKKKHNVFFADKTVSMGAHKISLFSDNAKDCIGKIVTATIGVSNKVFNKAAESEVTSNKIFLLSQDDVVFPEREELNTHKGTFGHCCTIAGDKEGAAILCSSSAFKCGAGLSSLLLKSNKELEFKIPASIMKCNELPSNVTAVALGPGFGRENDFASYIKLIEEKNVSVVFDADAFYYDEVVQFLDRHCSENSQDKKNVVLTPHPKEFSNLLRLCDLGDYSVIEVADNRLELVRSFCKKYPEAVLVLKGANTFIGHKDSVYISTFGMPCLSKGGSGDVLAGAVSGLLAQKIEPLESAVSGVLMHALASRKFKSSYNLTPEELIENL